MQKNSNAEDYDEAQGTENPYVQELTSLKTNDGMSNEDDENIYSNKTGMS